MYNIDGNKNFGLLKIKVLDIIITLFSFVISYFLRHGLTFEAYGIYITMSILIVCFSLAISISNLTYNNIIRREYFDEAIESIKYSLLVVLLSIIYLFLTQKSFDFSRLVFIYFWAIDCVGIFLSRSFLKHSIRIKLASKENSQTLIIVGGYSDVKKCISKITDDIYLNYKIVGTVITDSKNQIEGIPTVKDFHDFIINNPIDEVMMFYSNNSKTVEIYNICNEMGLTIHSVVYEMSNYKKTVTEEISDYTVITTCPSIINGKQQVAKRMLDIAVSIFGVIVTGFLALFVGPFIYFTDKGNMFFTQTRIGKNGHKFKLYKFRSMYMNAEDRKKELENLNEMDGLMFKMENDPRIIKGIGTFIRKTSIDEFPQFINVLKGDMSIVGTRPPTEDEYKKYEYHHMKRLSIKPGITGLWQISGRNEITDFEKVVELDTKYINEWSLKLDLKIIFKTIMVVITGKGAK